MMSRILSCSFHDHRTCSALIKCIWGCRVEGEGKWGWRCNSGNRVALYETKDEAEMALELHRESVAGHHEDFLLQGHLR